MSRMTRPDFAREYADWLRQRIVGIEHENKSIIATPFLNPFSDGIEIVVEHANGELLLHDDGETVDSLQSLGLRIEDSERRKYLITRALAGCGVVLSNGRLETRATVANVAQRSHFLITAILRLNDMWMSAVPHRYSDFSEMVSEFLDHESVLYTANVSIAGKTMEHPIEFIIPLPKGRERLIKLVGDPRPQTAKVIVFTWIDIRDLRPDSERVVLINDTRLPDPLSMDTVSEIESRKISEQIISVLRGFSDHVLKWSEHNSPEFKRLWTPEEKAA